MNMLKEYLCGNLRTRYRVYIEEKIGCISGKPIQIYIVESKKPSELKWWYLGNALTLEEAKELIEKDKDPQPTPITPIYEE